MTEIGKNHQTEPAPGPAAHPMMARWLAPDSGLIAQITQHMARCQAHPARTVVLLPFAQLLPVVARLWAQVHPDGFAPRLETTSNWSRVLGGASVGGSDIRFDPAQDGLTAQALLAAAGLGAQRKALAGMLQEAACQLAPLAAAQQPRLRTAWAAHHAASLRGTLESPILAQEAAVLGVALAWAGSSGYLTDVLYGAEVAASVDCLVLLQGFEPEAMHPVLVQLWGDRVASLPLYADAAPGRISLHAAFDLEDEAQRAAHCVLQHVQAGRYPVALVALDRALTRRVRAMLEGCGLRLRDENGWKLSTSRAGASVLALLRACAWNASTDTMLDWLKLTPALDAHPVRLLERTLRQQSLREWQAWQPNPDVSALVDLTAWIGRTCQAMQQARPLGQWLAALRERLQVTGQWAQLQAERDGGDVLTALHLHHGSGLLGDAPLAQTLWQGQRLSLAEFTDWVGEVLEAANCSPVYPVEEQVVIAPLGQLLGRAFAAVVLPGCDEVRLNPAAELPGRWSPSQRQALGLISRQTQQAAITAAWHCALQTPFCDVLWRCSDDSGETLLPSTLVQTLQLAPGQGASAADLRAQRSIAMQVQLPSAANGQSLPLSRLSASAYDDLRSCPYKFFALRQLGLRDSDELDTDLDQRDFGNWLHAVLRQFHEDLREQPTVESGLRRERLDAAAQAVSRSQRLSPADFVPFEAAWPALRDGYLSWLAGHEASGARFERAEVWCEQVFGGNRLVGKIDRLDRVGTGLTLVLDYKSEDIKKTRQRVANPLEDTQLAFYGALLPDDELAGAYVSIGERQGTETVVQDDIVAVRDALIDGVLHDMAQIASGAALWPLGQSPACDYCAARGLCRRDFWSTGTGADADGAALLSSGTAQEQLP